MAFQSFGVFEAPTLSPGNPAAGAELSITVTTGQIWEIIAVRYNLQTDATVAARTSRLLFDNGVTMFYQIETGTTQIESIDRGYVAAPQGQIRGTDGQIHHMPLPVNLTLQGGNRIRTTTTNLQAGDQYKTIAIKYRRIK